ncbi:MAG: hypothetical protein ACYS0E_07165 [Planctomycetota bacterium]
MPRLIFLPLLLLAGCFLGKFSENEPLDESLLKEFESGKTTAGDVTRVLGPPRRVVELDVRSAYLYEFSESKSAGLILLLVNFVNSDQRFDRVWFFFDSRDVLTHYGAHLSSHRSRFAMPWVNTHTKKYDDKADAKRAEQRAKEEAEAKALAGQPVSGQPDSGQPGSGAGE